MIRLVFCLLLSIGGEIGNLVCVDCVLGLAVCGFMLFRISNRAADSREFDLKVIRSLCELLIVLGVFSSLSSTVSVYYFNLGWFYLQVTNTCVRF